MLAAAQSTESNIILKEGKIRKTGSEMEKWSFCKMGNVKSENGMYDTLLINVVTLFLFLISYTF